MPRLRFLLDESDPELVIHAAKIATLLAQRTKQNVVANVLRVLPEAPWHLKEEATKCLEVLYDWGEGLISQARRRRCIAALMRLRSHVTESFAIDVSVAGKRRRISPTELCLRIGPTHFPRTGETSCDFL